VKEICPVICQQLNSLLRQIIRNHGNGGKEGFVKSSVHINVVVEYRFFQCMLTELQRGPCIQVTVAGAGF
jgi:hypothetical protein